MKGMTVPLIIRLLAPQLAAYIAGILSWLDAFLALHRNADGTLRVPPPIAPRPIPAPRAQARPESAAPRARRIGFAPRAPVGSRQDTAAEPAPQPRTLRPAMAMPYPELPRPGLSWFSRAPLRNFQKPAPAG